jgi:hypothetical protein
MKKFLFPLVISLAIPFLGYASEDPVKEGNFALPDSQTPAPLVSFGQRIIGDQVTQYYVFGEHSRGKKNRATEITPFILYGISDTSTISFNAPFAPSMKKGSHHSRGWEDASAQIESAVYTKTSKFSSAQATVVGSMTFPTGSGRKNPPTGFGAPSFFLGSTYNYTTPNWFGFTSYGSTFTTKHHGKRFGDQILYQAGYGGNIPSPRDWIYAWMVEFDGTYRLRNKVHGVKKRNSGGNTILMTPSLWASSERWIVQFGVGFPIVQHLFGRQHKSHYLLTLDLGYTF